tara:strand:- start:161 stop:1414 length:1254 start_codon:yes stop_codon:yes gene_type:complete
MIETLKNWLESQIAIEWINNLILQTTTIILLLLIGYVLFLVGKFIILGLIAKLIKKTETHIDDLLIQHRIPHRIIQLIILAISHQINKSLFFSETVIYNTNESILSLLIILSIVAIFDALLNFANSLFTQSKYAEKFPAKSLIQALKLILYFFGIIFILSIILDKSPLFFISGLGALTAVLLIVFKDPLLGLVAGVQVSANNLIQIGDWIEIPSHNSNGVVKDLTLTTLKVENWDQTISSIPMQTLITDSFKNWRQMGQSAGRRIKRSILIDANSIDFIDSELLDGLNQIPLLAEYLKEKDKELAEYNTSDSANSLNKTNIQRRLTNIGTFRAYCFEYLKNNPNVNSDLTLIVRQLEPTEGGIPLEIWTYSATTNWIAYESIQSDIFDHLYSVLHKFNLRVYQKPSGTDIASIAQSS